MAYLRVARPGPGEEVPRRHPPLPRPLRRSSSAPIPSPSSRWSRTSGRPATACPRSRCWAPRSCASPSSCTSSYPHEILHNWWGNCVYVDYASGNWCEGLTAYLADHLMAEERGATGARVPGDDPPEVRATTWPRPRLPAHRLPLAPQLGHRGASATANRSCSSTCCAGNWATGPSARGSRGSTPTTSGSAPPGATCARPSRPPPGRPLGPFFAQWVERTGAPALRLAGVRAEPRGDGWTVSGTIEQTQPGDAYTLSVPVGITTGGRRDADGDGADGGEADRLLLHGPGEAAPRRRGPGLRPLPPPRPGGDAPGPLGHLRREGGPLRPPLGGAARNRRGLPGPGRDVEEVGRDDARRSSATTSSGSFPPTAPSGWRAGRTGSSAG